MRDIVDVWFESGCTHVFTLQDRGLPWPADLYVEGSDQHRGWFQSSLLEAIGTRGAAPFKAILSHGFTLDDQGRKMSKSLFNALAPAKITDEYGADILRLWVMNTDITEDQRVGKEILKQQAELYRRLRNTLRWLLGSLAGFTPDEAVPLEDLPELERLVLHRLWQLDARVRHAAHSYDWAGLIPELHNFCATDLSAFYFDIRKDSLYCDKASAPRRRAARTVLDHLHRCLCIWLAPTLVFTAEEAWTTRFGDEDSVHLQQFPEIPAAWRDDALAELWQRIRDNRDGIMKSIEKDRAAKRIGSSLEVMLDLNRRHEANTLLPWDVWAEITITSQVSVWEIPAEHDAWTTSVAIGCKCARCWRVLPEVGDSFLCRRCTDAVTAVRA